MGPGRYWNMFWFIINMVLLYLLKDKFLGNAHNATDICLQIIYLELQPHNPESNELI